MIVKNEEKYLEGCLESARPFVDEIVIVDTGSTDKTVEIAKKYDAKIFTYAWTGNFSSARNESLKHSTSDWILYLDADERIIDGAALKKYVSNNQIWAYTLLVRGKVHMPSGIVDQEMAYPRLFRRHHKIRFEGHVHEQITPSIIRLGKKIECSDVVIDHLGYSVSAEINTEKAKRNITLLKSQLEKQPNNEYVKYQLGNSYVVIKEYDLAEPLLRSIAQSPGLASSIRSSIHNLFVEIALQKNDFDEAEQCCRNSLTITPAQTMARWFLTGIAAKRGKYQEALQMMNDLRSNLKITSKLAYDLILNERQIEERELYCYEMLSNDAEQRSDTNEAYRWIIESEKKKLLSVSLQRRGLNIALSRRDIPAANMRLEYLINHLPIESENLRVKFLELQRKLNQYQEEQGTITQNRSDNTIHSVISPMQ
jgi:glycosyltransferase involved in cell wall biosynthesis